MQQPEVLAGLEFRGESWVPGGQRLVVGERQATRTKYD